MSTPKGDQHGSEYRQYLPDLTDKRFTTMQKQDAHEYAAAFKESGQPPWFHALYLHWQKLAEEPLKGVTTDGIVRPGLFELRDEGIPIQTIVDAAEFALAQLNEEQREKVTYHIDSPAWRTWSNPEFLLFDKGIRFDELLPEVRDSFLKVLQATLSPEGYNKVLGAMRINHFLGQLVKSPLVLNEFSYNLAIFGRPSTTRPWGLSFYGHHLCLNIFFYKTQIVISPFFTGAEPNLIDDGPYKGTRILDVEERLGLELMQSLSADQQTKAQIYKQLKDPLMPRGRWNHDDQRHLCGAMQDNRIVPYEGILVSSLSTGQQAVVVSILEQYLLYLPESARKIQLDHIRSWFHETYFCWIGTFNNADPFYYRIQSPIIVIEFDHHSGVFLNNREPARFHIHTTLRTPNAGDYGVALKSLIPVVEHAFVWEG